MIRHSHGGEFILIAQHHHALLSGRLAGHIGGGPVARPSPLEPVIDGIALHDCGWPLHDDAAPTLNGKGLPLHVFEAPVLLATRVWSASEVLATAKGPYPGLLVSLHVLHLSLMAQEHAGRHTPQELFEINKFQHRQIEAQEKLRTKLGMRTDRPLRHGLAPPGTSDEEDRLLFDFRLLQAMDRLSLAVCCSEKLFDSIELLSGPGGAAVSLAVDPPAEFAVRLRPWPFDIPRIEVEVPCRRVPARPFDSDQRFREAYQNATKDAVLMRVSSG